MISGKEASLRKEGAVFSRRGAGGELFVTLCHSVNKTGEVVLQSIMDQRFQVPWLP